MPKQVAERPFACDVPGCDKSFANANNLSRHRRLHGVPQKKRGGNRRPRKEPVPAVPKVPRERKPKAKFVPEKLISVRTLSLGGPDNTAREFTEYAPSELAR
jgi:hypothetical protein